MTPQRSSAPSAPWTAWPSLSTRENLWPARPQLGRKDDHHLNRAGRPLGDVGEVLVDGQGTAIYPDLTGRENLSFFTRLYGIGRRDLKHRVDEVLETIGLTDPAGDRAKDYSGGMKRRLNIRIGLPHRPRLLILDEPTVGVDPQSRNQPANSWSRRS